METRMIEEVKIFKLIMNNMMGSTENGSIVAISTEREKLINWYNSLLVSGYKDIAQSSYGDGEKQFHKQFMKRSELEWYNPLNDINQIEYNGQGIHEEFISMDLYHTINILKI